MVGCGPSLQRPGWVPPPDTTPRPAMEVFHESQSDTIRQLRFHFDYLGFSVLTGVKQEVMRVLSKYPPTTSGGSSEVASLHIDSLIDAQFHQFTTSLGFAARDLECVRDYSRLCPSRWVDLGDGMTCEAPPALFSNQQCRQVTFGGLTPIEKSAAAFACDESKYPCRGECVQDYSSVCPEGWSQSNPPSTVCTAPATYVQPCVRTYDFADHSPKLKRKFGEMCKVVWPCMRALTPIHQHR